MRTLPVVLALGIGTFALQPAQAACSNATLNGKYLAGGTLGNIFPPAFGVTQPSVSAVAGFSVFNGDGTGVDTVTFTVNGKVVPVPTTQDTMYHINADCTGVKEVNGGPTFNIYVAPDGSKFSEVATGAPPPTSSGPSSGFAVSAVLTRVVDFSENQQ